MNYIKKYPLFFSILTTLLLAFTLAFVWNIFLFTSLSAAEVDYKRASAQYKRVQSQDPSDKSVKDSLANIEAVDGKLNKLLTELSPNATAVIKESPMSEGFSFQNYLRGLVDKWRADAVSANINLDAGECFGYSKYYKADSNPPLDVAVKDLWKQSSVLDYILTKLYSSKVEGVPMSLDSVQRESLEIEKEKEVADDASKKTSRFKTRQSLASKRQEKVSDVFAIDNIVSAKVGGSIDTLAYKLTFRTKTDVLRNFLNSLKDFDLMLVVRSVEVSIALPIENKIDPNATMGDIIAAEDKPKTAEELEIMALNAENQPIVRDNLSEFTVIIEYIELSKDEPKAKEASDEDAE